MNAFSLEGQRVLITGGGRGIGRAIAEAASTAGAELIIADLDMGNAEDAAQAIRAGGGRATAYKVDVGDRAAVQQLAATIQDSHGAVSGIVNNAGVDLRERLEGDDFFDKWRTTMRVNLDGPMYVVHAFLEQLKATEGAVVNLASTCSFVAGNGAPAYVASKGAIRLLTQVLARELSKYRIRVNAVAPAIVATAMTEEIRQNADIMARYNTRCPMQRPAQPAEIAAPVVMLLSKAASYMTGLTMPIDGGTLS